MAVTMALVASTQPALGANITRSLLADCQLKSNWCWVAGAQAIIDYHGPKYLQCTIYKWGKNYGDCSTNEAGSITTDLDRAFTAAGLANIGTATSGSVSFSTIVNEINANRPLLARMAWADGKAAHMVPIRGYNNDNGATQVRYAHIHDCPEATNYYIIGYSSFFTVNGWSWSYTRKGMS